MSAAARHLKHAPARARNAEEIGGPESRAERLALAQRRAGKGAP